jgi:hypothetical protein
MAELDEQQKKWLDAMVKRRGLNRYGDRKDTVYAGGTPLFDEKTGKTRDRHEYIRDRNPDWLPRAKKKS